MKEIEKISDKILKQLKNIQRESVTSKVTPVTFSEWMLRDSGIYLLNKDYQQKFIDKYSIGKYRWDNSAVLKKVASILDLCKNSQMDRATRKVSDATFDFV